MANSNRPRRIQIYESKALASDKGTETFPLPTNGMITEITLQVRAKNGALNDFDTVVEATPEMAVKNIEVRCGSAIFKSYTGEMCRKIATYRNGRLPQSLRTSIAGGTWAGNGDPLLGWCQDSFPINFTTKQDPLGNKTNVVFPAPLYKDLGLELKIDYDFAISATSGFVTGGSNHIMDMYATVLPRQDNISMQNKKILTEVKKIDYTTVASGDQAFALTREPAGSSSLRQLFTDVYAQGIGDGIHLTKLRIDEDGNQEVSAGWGNLQAKNASDCSLNYEKIYYLDPTDGTTVIYTRVPSALALLTPIEAPTIVPWVAYNNDTLTVTNDSGEQVLVRVRSDVIPGMTVLDFDLDGLQQNMQPTNVNSLDLVVTNGSASGAASVLEQHVSQAWGYQ
jgi:hypothetical protein